MKTDQTSPAPTDDVRPGLWRHYKGGLYTVLGTVTHHETRKPMVLYISHTYGGANVRPVRGWEGDFECDSGCCQDMDGWLDPVLVRASMSANVPDETVTRFVYVGELPSDTPIKERA